MTRYRRALPQLADEMCLTDSGLETDLIFHCGMELSLFAAFPLVDDSAGAEVLRDYYRRHALVAEEANVGFVLEAPTWRASSYWGSQLGYTSAQLDAVNRRAIVMLTELRAELGERGGPMVISGSLGPRSDGYNPDVLMDPEQARRYHMAQIETLSTTEADLATAMTLTYAAEAIGIAQAATATGMPVAIAFTVETDGRLPDGSSLAEAIAAVDDATSSAPVYYGINCAHPTHLSAALDPAAAWVRRIRMIRANASTMSHAELDNASQLDDGDPEQFGREYAQLLQRLPWLNVLGGCCGSDVRHLRAIAQACL